MKNFTKKLNTYHCIWRGRNVSVLFLFFAIVAGGTESLFAQDEKLPDGVVPPPLVFVTDDEKEKLEAEKKIKTRTKLSLVLMENRIVRSEEFSSESDFQKSLIELGHFEALMKNTLSFLQENSSNKGILRNFKRFEIGLRQFIPRLGNLKRALPYSHSYHVGKLIGFVRDTRETAQDQFYSTTVIEGGYRE